MSETTELISIQTMMGFRAYYDERSPQLYTYLIDRVGSSDVANELLMQVFYKLNDTKKIRPDTISLDSWLLLLTKNLLMDYFKWRQTEEGKKAADQTIPLSRCKELADEHEAELKEWIKNFTEDEVLAYDRGVLGKQPPSIVEKYNDIKAKEGTVGVLNRIKEWADKNGKPRNK